MGKARRRGSIRKRGENSWQVKVSIGHDEGKKRKLHAATFKTKREAEQYLSKTIRESDQGTFVESADITLNEYFNKWHESVSNFSARDKT